MASGLWSRSSGALAFRLEVGWRTISLILIIVPLLVALGFVNVDLPPLISEREGGRTALRDLCRDSSFLAVNAAIFPGGALELGLAQWLPAYAEMSLGFSMWTGSISLLAFSAAMALGQEQRLAHQNLVHALLVGVPDGI